MKQSSALPSPQGSGIVGSVTQQIWLRLQTSSGISRVPAPQPSIQNVQLPPTESQLEGPGRQQELPSLQRLTLSSTVSAAQNPMSPAHSPPSAAQPSAPEPQVAVETQLQQPPSTTDTWPASQVGRIRSHHASGSVGQPCGTHAATQSSHPGQLLVPQGSQVSAGPQSLSVLQSVGVAGQSVAGSVSGHNGSPSTHGHATGTTLPSGHG